MSWRLPELSEARARADERIRMGAELQTLQGRVEILLTWAELLMISGDPNERLIGYRMKQLLNGEAP